MTLNVLLKCFVPMTSVSNMKLNNTYTARKLLIIINMILLVGAI